jgi:GTPase SAR1 family protein
MPSEVANSDRRSMSLSMVFKKVQKQTRAHTKKNVRAYARTTFFSSSQMGAQLCGQLFETDKQRDEELTSTNRNVVLLGARGVGKSAFAAAFPQEGEDATHRRFQISALPLLNADIWDRPGSGLGTDMDAYLASANVLVFLYSLADPTSWHHLQLLWTSTIERPKALQAVLLVGTHADSADHSWEIDLTALKPYPLKDTQIVSVVQFESNNPNSNAQALLRTCFPGET